MFPATIEEIEIRTPGPGGEAPAIRVRHIASDGTDAVVEILAKTVIFNGIPHDSLEDKDGGLLFRIHRSEIAYFCENDTLFVTPREFVGARGAAPVGPSMASPRSAFDDAVGVPANP